MREIGIVILTWNSERYIANCLRSILAIDPHVFQNTVVIVDNGSKDRTLEVISEEQNRHQDSLHKLSVVCFEKNYGTTVSRNYGLRKLLSLSSNLEYICILDSDTEINETALLTMSETSNNLWIGIVGPRLHNAAGIYQISGKDFSTVTEKILKVMPIRQLRELGERMESMIPVKGTGYISVGFLVSACWMMRRDAFDKLGYLDEEIFYAPEDLEYCIRCWKMGMQVTYCYDADIFHQWQRISRKKLFSKHNFEQIRGLIHVFVKYQYFFSTKRLWKSFNILEKNRQ